MSASIELSNYIRKKVVLAALADSLDVEIPAGFEIIRLFAHIIASGSINVLQRFNDDAGSNYSWRSSINGAADATGNPVAQIELRTAASGIDVIVNQVIANLRTSAKLVQGDTTNVTPGAANAPSKREHVGQWYNIVDSIRKISLLNTDTGDYAIGSYIVVEALK